MKKWQSLLLGVIVSVATLAYALQGNDISKIAGELARGRYIFLIPCVIFVIISLALRAARWRVMLSERIAFKHSFHILNISYFFGAWLPFRLGEVVRSYLTTRLDPPISMFTSLSSVVVERVIDLLTVVILFVIAISSLPEVRPEIMTVVRSSAVLAVVGTLVLMLFALRPKLAHWIVDRVMRLLPFLERFHLRSLTDRVLDGLAPLGSARGLIGITVWTALAWIGSVIAGYFLMYTFYDTPSWTAIILVIASASVAIAVPAAPGSVGPFELAVILGLSAGGMIDANNSQEKAFAFAIFLHLVNVSCYAGAGMIGLGQEKLSFGEVIRLAQQLVGKKSETTETTEESAPISSTP